MTASRNRFRPTDEAIQTMIFRPEYLTFDGHGPGNPAYCCVEINDIGGLPGVVRR